MKIARDNIVVTQETLMEKDASRQATVGLTTLSTVKHRFVNPVLTPGGKRRMNAQGDGK